jgi:hypothetical protein
VTPGATVDPWRLLKRILIAPDHIVNGQKNNTDIQPETPVLHVPDIMLDPFFHLVKIFRLPPESIHLRPAGDARLYKLSDHEFIQQTGIVIRMFQHMWPRTDDTHISPQHVEELGKLVQAGAPQKSAETRDPVVTAGSLLPVGLIIDHHRPEFQTGEALIILARTGLYKEDGTLGVQQYQQADNGYHPGKNEDNNQRADKDIEYPPADPVAQVFKRFPAEGNDRHVFQVVDKQLLFHKNAQVGYKPEADTVPFRPHDQVIKSGILLRGNRGIDLGRPVMPAFFQCMADIAQNRIIGYLMNILLLFTEADDLGIDTLILQVMHQFLREMVITDDDDLLDEIFLFSEILVDDKIEEPVGQQEYGNAAHDRYDKGPGDGYLTKKEEVQHREPDEIQKGIHRLSGEQFKIHDRLPGIDAADPADPRPAEIQEVEKGIVFDKGGIDNESLPEKIFAEKEYDIDDQQVQHYKGDLEMIYKPVIHIPIV